MYFVSVYNLCVSWISLKIIHIDNVIFFLTFFSAQFTCLSDQIPFVKCCWFFSFCFLLICAVTREFTINSDEIHNKFGIFHILFFPYKTCFCNPLDYYYWIRTNNTELIIFIQCFYLLCVVFVRHNILEFTGAFETELNMVVIIVFIDTRFIFL